MKRKSILQNKKLSIVAIIIFAGLAISLFYHYFMSAYFGLGYPFNTFLFIPEDRFNDFFNNYRQITSTGQGVFAPEHNFMNYLFFLPSLFSFHSQILAYAFYAVVFVVYLFYYNYINIKKNGDFDRMGLSLLSHTCVFTLMTYPVIFVIDRGNQEMYVFIIMSLSILFYYDKKFIVSALLLGFAVHIKIYFAVFLLIYLADKKYREIGVVILLFIILPFLALLIDQWLFPEIKFAGSNFIFLKSAASSENWYNNLYVLGDGGAAYCSSLYGALKAILYYIFPDIRPGSFPIYRLFRIYFPISLLFAGIVALYVLLFEKEVWRQVTLVTFSLILFPFVTADYRLIMLFIPLWMFLNSKQLSKYNNFYAVLFGLLLIPKDYYIIRNNISISVIINPLLISIFTIFLLCDGSSTELEQNSEKLKKAKGKLKKNNSRGKNIIKT